MGYYAPKFQNSARKLKFGTRINNESFRGKIGKICNKKDPRGQKDPRGKDPYRFLEIVNFKFSNFFTKIWLKMTS